jgi:HAD superfamily hydrolase (TIGR01662 family)
VAQLRAVCFDLDDTLCDEAGSVLRAVEATARHAGQRLGTDWRALADVYQRVGNALWMQFDSWGRGLGKLAVRRYVWRAALLAGGFDASDDLVAKIAEHYTMTRERDHRWIGGARQGLLVLRRSYRIGLITNGSTEIQREKVRALGLDRLCHCIVVAEECGCSKPAPGIFERAMRKLEVEADECVMVGDRPEADIVGAHAVGMRSVWIAPDDAVWPLRDRGPWRRARSVALVPGVVRQWA